MTYTYIHMCLYFFFFVCFSASPVPTFHVSLVWNERSVFSLQPWEVGELRGDCVSVLYPSLSFKKDIAFPFSILFERKCWRVALRRGDPLGKTTSATRRGQKRVSSW